jgi:histidinol-phosphate phosphatase family protein
MKTRAVIFDRDGVLNDDIGYAHKIADLRWRPGAVAAIAALNRRGVLAIVATNQSGVARGLFDEAAVQRFHGAMQSDLEQAGARIDAFYFCPFHPEASVPRFRHPDHPDRKPNPGMILRALNEWSIPAAASLLIGDKTSDMEAARRAGVRGVLYEGGDLAALVARETA